MAKKKKDFKSTKVKKRIWVELLAPKVFNHQSLGFTHVDEKEDAVGKTMSINLMSLTGDPKKQGVSINFKVVKIEGEKAYTEFIGWQMLPSALKRIVRRNRNRVDASFVCKTQDGKHVRVKPMVISRSKGNSSLVKGLRRNMVDFVTRALMKVKFEQLAMDLVSRRFQNQFRERMQKMHPIAACEMRVCHVETSRKTGAAPKPAEPKAAEEAPAEKAEA